MSSYILKLAVSTVVFVVFIGFHSTAQQGMGIGNNNPLEMLDVTGAIKLGTTSNTNAGTIRWNGAAFQGYDGSQWNTFGYGDDGDWTVSGNHIYNANTAYVGIGTNAPDTKFHVALANGAFRLFNNPGNAGTVILAELKGTNNLFPQMRFTGGGTGGDVDLGKDANGSFVIKSNGGVARLVIKDDGNVGIGTSTPTANLDVVGDLKVSNKLMLGNFNNINATTNTLTFTIDGTGGAEALLIADGASHVNTAFKVGTNVMLRSNGNSYLAGGNLGLGLLNPAEKLHVIGSIRMVDGNEAVGFIPVSDANGTMTWTNPATIATSYVDEIRDADNDTKIQVEESANEDEIRFDIAGTEEMVITNNGNIGMGNATPKWPVTVSTASALFSSTDIVDPDLYALTLSRPNGNNDQGIGIGFGASNSGLHAGAGIAFKKTGINSLGDLMLTVKQDGTSFGPHFPAVTVKSISGFMGVGTTDPRSEIHITDGSPSLKTADFGASLLITDNAIARIYFEAQGEAADKKLMDISLQDQTLAFGSLTDAGDAWDTQNILTVHRDGNVGIGIAAPNLELHVHDPAAAHSFMSYTHTGSGASASDGFQIGLNTNNEARFILKENASMDFLTNNIERMTIQASGNVGIMTPNPQDALHVQGSIRMVDGNQADGYIPVSDVNGTMVWTDPTSISDGDWTLNGNDIYSANSGNVGIGTISPDKELSVVGIVRGANDVAETEYTEIGHGGLHGYINTVGDGNLDFRHDGTALMSLLDNGNFGISTTSPAAKLHVNGTSRFDGIINTNNQWISGDGGAEGINIDDNGNIRVLGNKAMVFGGSSTDTPDSTPDAQLVLDGAHNAGFNNGTKLLIRGIDNETSRIAIKVEDENGDNLFQVESGPAGEGETYFRGDVGIGTLSPTYKFQVNDAVNGNSDFVAWIRNTADDSDTTPNNGLRITAGQDGSGTFNGKYIVFSSPNGGTMGKVVQNGGSTVSFATSSDIRLKTNIQPTVKGLNELMQIEVRDYMYKTDLNSVKTGFIAQQLNEWYPDAVARGGEDAKTDPWMVDYGKVTPLLVKSIQDLKHEKDMLEAANDLLQQQVNGQESVIQDLLQRVLNLEQD